MGLITRYRERLPFAPGDPVVSLEEGSTPLVLAERVSERVGVEVWLKLEGANPTGSFKDRGMTCAVSDAVRNGNEAVICASTGNTAASLAAYAARGGPARRGDRARGQDRHRQARPGADARRARDRAARQLRRGAEARPRARERHPIALVNSVNPFRLEGQKTAAFEVSTSSASSTRSASRSATPATSPRTGRASVEMGAAPRLFGFQAEGAAPLVLGAPVANPETVASAIRIGNPARWEEAMEAFTSSRGAVERGQRRADPRRLPLPRRPRGRLLRAGRAPPRSRGC